MNIRPSIGLAAVVAALLFQAPAVAAESPLGEADKACLACHNTQGMEKTFPNGETGTLYVAEQPFAGSVHAPVGCAACHSDVSPASHPPGKREFKSPRERTLAMSQACRQCHDDKVQVFESSVHAAAIRNGNEGAAACADCHTAHSVRYAAVADRPRTACLDCHKGALDAHKTWLPNTERHFAAVACAVCHSPAAEMRVDLRLIDPVTKQRLSEKDAHASFERLVKSLGEQKVLDAVSLRELVRQVGETNGGATLGGRLEVTSGLHPHQLADRTQARSDCASCHRQGANPFQMVTVSIIGPDGRVQRHEARQDVLNSVLSVDSMRGFYAIGGTRITLLDVLLVLAVLGALSVPIGHVGIKWLYGAYVKRRGKDRATNEKDAS